MPPFACPSPAQAGTGGDEGVPAALGDDSEDDRSEESGDEDDSPGKREKRDVRGEYMAGSASGNGKLSELILG